MDAANLTEKYILWSNILDLRSRGINIARTARRLGVSRNTVRHLQSLSLEEVLQHKERHYKLHAYEQAVASLLTSCDFPSYLSFPHGLLEMKRGYSSCPVIFYIQKVNAQS